MPVRARVRPPSPVIARSCTSTGRWVRLSNVPVPSWGPATAYDTTPALPATTAPGVSHALRFTLSGLYAWPSWHP